MSQVEWSEAPEGATHYRPAMHCPWYRLDSRGVWFFWTGFVWSQFLMQPGVIDKLIARPSPAWSGEGLPPAGSECEKCYNSPNEYYRVKIIGHDGELAVFRWMDGPCAGELSEKRQNLNMSINNPHWSFRPIRTPEQIAADEREAAISDLTQFFMNYYGDPKGAEKYFLVSRSLHDAGYRKQEQPK